MISPMHVSNEGTSDLCPESPRNSAPPIKVEIDHTEMYARLKFCCLSFSTHSAVSHHTRRYYSPSGGKPYVLYSLGVYIGNQLVHTVAGRYSDLRVRHEKLPAVAGDTSLIFPSKHLELEMTSDHRNVELRAHGQNCICALPMSSIFALL
eukprot:SAG31_NODE_4431_length_3236_cov_2.397832_3_plen_150_part_00